MSDIVYVHSTSLIQTEIGLHNWLSISFVITTLVPTFFNYWYSKSMDPTFHNFFFITLMILNIVIIILAFVPFYYRHKDNMNNITSPSVKKRESYIFIGQCVFIALYLCIAICTLYYMIYRVKIPYQP